MNEKSGVVFSIAKDNEPVKGCTISKSLFEGDISGSYFSLASHTSISKEIYSYPRYQLVLNGMMQLTINSQIHVNTGEFVVTPVDIPVGNTTDTGCVYLELNLRKETKMNEIVEVGKVFQLKDLLPYQEGKIVNMDLINDEKMKLVIMSFSAGTGLSEHAAPGEALLLGLDGEGVIGYEGKEHILHAGESFKFAKNGKHYVRVNQNFKMALLLTLE